MNITQSMSDLIIFKHDAWKSLAHSHDSGEFVRFIGLLHIPHRANSILLQVNRIILQSKAIQTIHE